MKIFAISDLHLSGACDKPMDVFGGNWVGYWQEIVNDWNSKVSDNDIVLISGDISWAMNLQQVDVDLKEISKLAGKKAIIRGNHDYWWQSYSKLKQNLSNDFLAIQNNCIRHNNLLICGSRLWSMGSNNNDEDKKILDREYIRLKMSLDEMQKMRKHDDYVVVMTHYPPFDGTFLPNRFTDLIAEYKVNWVTYGHLHGKDCRVRMKSTYDNIDYYLTSCDKLNNQLLLIAEI